MKNELTEKEKELIPIVRDRWLNQFFSLPRINEVECIKGVEWLYEYCQLSKPKVMFAKSPMEAQLFAALVQNEKLRNMVEGTWTDQEFPNGGDYVNSQYHNLPTSLKRFLEQENLKGEKKWNYDNMREEFLKNFNYESLSDYGNIGDFGWIAFYDFFVEIGIVDYEPYLKLRDLMKTGVYDMIQLDSHCIVIENPVTLHRLGDQMHSVSGNAIEWSDGYGLNFIKGRFVDHQVFEAALRMTKEDYLKIQNDDERMVVHEILGEKMMEFLDAELVDECTFVHPNGEVEEMKLYHTKGKFEFAGNSKGELNQPLAWLEMHCPSTDARYLKPVCPLWGAEEAAKNLRPEYISKDVPYAWDQRN